MFAFCCYVRCLFACFVCRVVVCGVCCLFVCECVGIYSVFFVLLSVSCSLVFDDLISDCLRFVCLAGFVRFVLVCLCVC